eukprot:11810109-Alexandrium_andersonii.AAC.1
MAEEECRDAEASDAERIRALDESVPREHDRLRSEQAFIGHVRSCVEGMIDAGGAAEQSQQFSSSSSEEAVQEPGSFERAQE